MHVAFVRLCAFLRCEARHRPVSNTSRTPSYATNAGCARNSDVTGITRLASAFLGASTTGERSERNAVEDKGADAMASRNDIATKPAVSDTRPGTRIEIKDVAKRFLTPKGLPFTAIQGVDFVVDPGQLCAVVAPTGCGKPPLLSLECGPAWPSSGAA